MTAADLMENDRETPSSTKIRSFLGMANYYSHFIEGLSGMAKPLFILTVMFRKCLESECNVQWSLLSDQQRWHEDEMRNWRVNDSLAESSL